MYRFTISNTSQTTKLYPYWLTKLRNHSDAFSRSQRTVTHVVQWKKKAQIGEQVSVKMFFKLWEKKIENMESNIIKFK